MVTPDKKDIHEIEAVIDKAFYIANEGKKGLLHIDFPKCVSYQNYEPNLVKMYKTVLCKQKKKHEVFICKDKLKHVAKIINNSKAFIVLGQG